MSGNAEPLRISLQDAADRLGVHYMTAYRYVRTGRLPASKEGAEWRVAVTDVDAFRAAAESRTSETQDATGPNGRGAAGRDTTRNQRPATAYHDRLESRLLAGDEAGAWKILEDAMTAGLESRDVYLDVMSPALASIGEGWVAGTVSVAEEHRASVVTLRLIGRLGPTFARRGRKRGSLVIGAAPGDHHGVPVAMAGDLLRGEGFAVIDLGADSPAESFIDAARDAERLIAIGINATSADNETAIAATIAAIKAELDCPVVLGGSGVASVDAGRALGADVVTTSAAEAIAAFDELAVRRTKA